LVELLVVIAIVGILAALLLPVLSRAKASAYRADCLNRQRQWAQEFISYPEDHEGLIPREGWEGSGEVLIHNWSQVAGFPLDTGGRDTDEIWFNALPPKLGLRPAYDYARPNLRDQFYDRRNLLQCPSARFPRDVDRFSYQLAIFSLSMNSHLIRAGEGPTIAFSSIVTDMDKVVGTLQAVIHEMEARYRRFSSIGVRNLESYNKHAKAPSKLPYWVVIIDELADLMMAAPYEVEKQICRLAQLARATGIHLVVATQRPSVDVVTGLIKANFPTRIAFAMSSQVDSRTILDIAGAEKLLGRGDMLFLPTDAAKPRRLQGVYVSDQEIDRLVSFWTQDRFQEIDREMFDTLLEKAQEEVKREPAEDEDPMFEAAKTLATEHQRISTSMLQRRLRIGYPRAARLMDQLEDEGVVGPPESGGASRIVLIGASSGAAVEDAEASDEDEDEE
jgi:hypothetical protein